MIRGRLDWASGNSARGGLSKVPVWLIRLLVLAILIAAGYLVWRHFNHDSNQNKPVVRAPLAQPTQVEALNSPQDQSALSDKDYTSYQASKQALATNYLVNLKNDDAERVMNDVLTNVPKDKITSASYSTLYQAEKAKGDVALQKKYLSLMIVKLKVEGNETTAAAAQQELDQL